MIGKVFKILSRLLAVQREYEKSTKQGKPWYKSKTLWTNIVALIASIAALKGVEITPQEQNSLLLGILAAVNIILRLITHEPVRL